MPTPHIPTYLKVPHYRIQHPNTALYARIEGAAPAKPEPAEDANGSVSWKSSHIQFRPAKLASYWWTRDAAEHAFASHIGIAPLEIVRCEPIAR